jgi:two-component system response regulator YesN
VQKIIAILDDEPEMEEIYSLLLDEEIFKKKINFNFFSDARIFARWIEENKPDIVMTDINMPYFTGHDVIRIVKSKCPFTKTFIVSGDDEFEHTQMMSELGVNTYFSKPIDLQAFQGSLNLI